MTTHERSTVVGVFEQRAQAEMAVRELERAGFKDDQIGFVTRNEEAREGVTAPASPVDEKTETRAGAAAGAVSGGIIGGIIGAASALLIPGIGPVLAGGILIATISGAAIGAAAGGLVGALVGLGVPEEEAGYYESEFQSGRTLVTVRADGRQQEALDILRRNGAYDASTRFGQAPTPTYGSTVNSDLYSANRQAEADQMAQPGTTPGTSTSSSGPTTSPREYDPVTGPTQAGAEQAPVNSSGYGLRRDPTVETDATAKTYDRNVRPGTVVEDGSQDSSFEHPVNPDVVEPADWNDPNDRLPRVP